MDQAEVLYQGNSLEKAFAVAQEVFERAGTCNPSEAAILKARAREAQALVFQDYGQTPKAFDAYQEAAEEIAAFQEHREFLGRLQLSLYQICNGLFLPGRAAEFLELARANCTGTEFEVYIQIIDAGPDPMDESLSWVEKRALLEEQLAWASQQISELQEHRRFGKRDRERRKKVEAVTRHFIGCVYKLSILNIDNGTPAEVQEAYEDVCDIAIAYATDMIDLREFHSLSRVLIAVIDRPAKLTSKLVELTPLAMKAAHKVKSPELLAQAHYFAALLAYEAGSFDEALGNILNSVSLGTQSLARADSIVMRELVRDDLDGYRDFALMLAISKNDARLAAELVESERLQALPIQATELLLNAQAVDLGESVKATRSVLGQPLDVSVAGHSHLAGRALYAAEEVLPPLALEETIRRVGGADAWWWGTCVRFGRIHWVVRTPHGQFYCGTRRITEEQIDFVAEWDRQYVAQNLGDEEKAIWEDYEQESEYSRLLADLVVPPPLRQALLAAVEPISLVVAGNFMSSLPLPAFIIDQQSGTRLVERAVVRIQAPSVIVQAVDANCEEANYFPLLISCTDPSGDLQYSYHPELDGRISLTNRCHGVAKEYQATRANLIAALRRGQMVGQPGLFFYSGHIGTPDTDGSSNSALVLQDEDILRAGDWVGVFGTERLQAATRVVLSACSSSGSGGAGGGEWLGYGAALLLSGARQVIATTWPVYDTPFTHHFEATLVLALISHSDPAAALAQLQRDALDDWRQGYGGVGASPIIWAAYQMVGVRI